MHRLSEVLGADRQLPGRIRRLSDDRYRGSSTTHNLAVSIGSVTLHDSRSPYACFHSEVGDAEDAVPAAAGVRGEDLACAELELWGLQVLEQNWRCRLGEIDIIATEQVRAD
jgi:hypothetical protein